MKRLILGLIVSGCLTNFLYADSVDERIEAMVANGAAKGIVSSMLIHEKTIIKKHKAKQHIIQRCKKDKKSKRFINLCIKYAINKFNNSVQKQYKIVK